MTLILTSQENGLRKNTIKPLTNAPSIFTQQLHKMEHEQRLEEFLSTVLKGLDKKAFPELGFAEQEDNLPVNSPMTDAAWTMCLNLAIVCQEHEVITGLLSYQKDSNHSFHADSQGQMPMHFAVMSKSPELLQKFCDRNPQGINYPNQEGNTPLHYAAFQKESALISILLHTVAFKDPNAINDQNARKETALHIAVARGNDESTKLLLENGALVNLKDENEQTPLHIAAKRGYIKLAKLLLEKNADIQAKDHKGRTPLHIAAKEGHYFFLESLLEGHHELIDVKNNKNETLLMTVLNWYASSKNTKDCIRENQKEIAILLVMLGADLTIKDEKGHTFLHKAVIEGDAYIVELLLGANAEVDLKDQYGKTPLHLAAEQADLKILELLLDHGADIRAQDLKGQTPLHVAVEYVACEIVEYLLQKKDINLDIQNDKGRTPFLQGLIIFKEQLLALKVESKDQSILSQANKNLQNILILLLEKEKSKDKYALNGRNEHEDSTQYLMRLLNKKKTPSTFLSMTVNRLSKFVESLSLRP